jgi:4-hydroxy-4-methyl-2-oxoglutarate aldolase
MLFDSKTIDRIRSTLYSGVLSDVLDSLGHTGQAMRPDIRPVDDSLVLFGHARTGLYMDVYEVEPDENPYEIEIALIDDLKPGDVAVFGCGTSGRIAPWGELLTTASMCRKAVGCVTDGLVRDLRRIKEMRFPVFHGGIGPLDSRGRGKMMRMDGLIDCAGVKLRTGDWVFGDIDGVVVLPEKIAAETIRLAFEKVESENNTRRELLEGRLLGEVYRKYGVL